jgi:hypothetical protein
MRELLILAIHGSVASTIAASESGECRPCEFRESGFFRPSPPRTKPCEGLGVRVDRSAGRELALANPMRKLNASDCHRCGLDGLEPEHWRTPSLDRSVILFDDVVEVLAGSNMHALPCWMLAAKQPESAMARPVAIERYLLRRTVRMRGEGLPEEGLGGSDAAVLA